MGHKSLLTGRATCWSSSVGRVTAVGAPPSQHSVPSHCMLPFTDCSGEKRAGGGTQERAASLSALGTEQRTAQAFSAAGLLSIHDALLGLEFGHTNTLKKKEHFPDSTSLGYVHLSCELWILRTAGVKPLHPRHLNLNLRHRLGSKFIFSLQAAWVMSQYPVGHPKGFSF